ncbi:MAG: hypothetical protein ACAH07_06040 [Methylophilaceae bacterium]|nr:hypothetical protein [Methyloradius sp.]
MKMIRRVPIDDSSFVSSNVAENDYAAHSMGTTYALTNRVIVVAANVHKVFESLQSANTGHNPLLDDQKNPVWWLEVSATNRWKMLDSFVSSQTANPNSIILTLAIDPLIDSVSLQNIDGTQVHLTMTVPVDGLVYDKTINLISDSGIDDYFEYWFSPIEKLSTYNFTDLSLYSDSSILVELINDGGIAKCGALVVGLSRDYGGSMFGLELGRTDYSAVVTDDFGNTSITKRGNTRDMNLTLWVSNNDLASVDKVLSEYLSVPAVYIGTDVYQEATTLYAIYQSYSLVVSYPNQSLLSIRFKGLI